MAWTIRKTQTLAFGLAASVMIMTVALSGKGQPSVEHVSGRYKSDCCGEMVVSPRSVTYDGRAANVSFHHMKFGLTAYADQPVGPFYSVSDDRRKGPIIYFDGADSFKVATYHGETARFVRIR